jgi:hypothetical protein
MTDHDVLVRLRAANPLPAGLAERPAGAPWVSALRERILAVDPAPAGLTIERRGRSLPALAAAGLLLVGGGTLAANEIRNAVETAPDTPAGAQYAQTLLAQIRDMAPELSEGFVAPMPESARVVFSAHTRHGEYTIWRARTETAGAQAMLYSSPRAGVSIGTALPRRLPRAPFVVVETSRGSASGGVREVFGRVSDGVASVRVELKNGRRARAIVADGWFVFSQDFGHAKPTRLVGLDRQGRVLVVSEKGLF